MKEYVTEKTLLANVAISQLARYCRKTAQLYTRRYRLELARTMRKLDKEGR